MGRSPGVPAYGRSAQATLAAFLSVSSNGDSFVVRYGSENGSRAAGLASKVPVACRRTRRSAQVDNNFFEVILFLNHSVSLLQHNKMNKKAMKAAHTHTHTHLNLISICCFPHVVVGNDAFYWFPWQLEKSIDVTQCHNLPMVCCLHIFVGCKGSPFVPVDHPQISWPPPVSMPPVHLHTTQDLVGQAC